MDFTSLGCSYVLPVFSVGIWGLSACSAYASLACLLVACAVCGSSDGLGGVYDDRLQFVTRDDALSLDEALRGGDVSREAAFADAYQFAGCPVHDRGLVLGRGSFLVRTVRLGGPKVRKARRNFADPQEGVMCLCIMTLLPLSCLISGVDLRLWGICLML